MTSDTDSKIQHAFERLMLGRPEITDGTLTVSNICTEAGVSRASYYRSPQAALIKKLLDTPKTQRPETEDLRAQVKQLAKTERQLRTEHAAQVRELRATIKTYLTKSRCSPYGSHSSRTTTGDYKQPSTLQMTTSPRSPPTPASRGQPNDGLRTYRPPSLETRPPKCPKTR